MPRLNEMLWSLRTGAADEDAKVAAAWAVGESGDKGLAKHLLPLLEDPSSEVRYYALQALVFELQQTDNEMTERCWEFFLTDPEDEVRSIAVAALGKIHFGDCSRTIFGRLKDELQSKEQSARVKESIYDVLFQVMGRPPCEWPRVAAAANDEWDFDESDIDWKKLAEFEQEIEAVDKEEREAKETPDDS